MIVCCNREMKVEKNGVGVETQSGGIVYPGDRYVCLACHRTVVLTWEDNEIPGGVIRDPDHDIFSEYVTLKN